MRLPWKKHEPEPEAGTMEESSTIWRMTSTQINDEVTKAVRRADFPAESPEFEDALEEEAEAQVGAVAEEQIDPEHSFADDWMMKRMKSYADDVQSRQAAVENSLGKVRAAEDELALAETGMSVLRRFFVEVCLLVAAAVAILAVAALLFPAIDMVFYRPYWRGVLEGDAEQYSAQWSMRAAVGYASALVGLQTGSVLLTRGRLGWLTKLTFIAADLIFSLAFALLRAPGELSPQVLAISGLELAPLLINTGLVLAVSPILRRDSEKADILDSLADKLQRFRKQHKDAKSLLDSAESRFNDELGRIAARETAAGRVRRHKTFARAAARAAYLTAVSELIAEKARNTEAEVLNKQIGNYLESEFKQFIPGNDQSEEPAPHAQIEK